MSFTNLFADGELTGIPSNLSAYDRYVSEDILKSVGMHVDTRPNGSSWESMGEKEGIIIDVNKQFDNTNNRYRGMIKQIPVDVARIETVLRIPENYKALSPDIIEVKILRELDKNHRIVLITANVAKLLATREFLLLYSHINMPDGVFITAFNSINLPEYPANNVRAKMTGCGYVVEPIIRETSQSKFHFVMQAELNGWLPSGLINFFAEKGLKSVLQAPVTNEETGAQYSSAK